VTQREVFFHGYKFTLYSQIQLALFKQISALFIRDLIYLPVQKNELRGSHFPFFFLLFEPSYSALESRELLGQEMESELQINQSCLMSWYCNTQTDVTGNWWMPHLHVKLTGNVGNSFHSDFVVTFNSDWYHLLAALFCSPLCSAKEGNFFLPPHSPKRWGFQLFITNSLEAGSKRKKKIFEI